MKLVIHIGPNSSFLLFKQEVGRGVGARIPHATSVSVCIYTNTMLIEKRKLFHGWLNNSEVFNSKLFVTDMRKDLENMLQYCTAKDQCARNLLTIGTDDNQTKDYCIGNYIIFCDSCLRKSQDAEINIVNKSYFERTIQHFIYKEISKLSDSEVHPKFHLIKFYYYRVTSLSLYLSIYLFAYICRLN